MQHPSVVEEDQVTFLPIMCVDLVWSNTRPLQPIYGLPHLLQVVHHRPVLQVQLPDSRRVHLQSQLPGDRVPPAHGQDLDLVLLDLGELVQRDLLVFAHQPEPSGPRLGAAHPDIWVGRVFDLRGAREFLVLGRQLVEHVETTDECGSAKRNIQLIARAIVVSADLPAAAGHLDSKEGGDDGRSKAVQGGIDMPPVEPGEVQVVGGRDRGCMEGLVVRMAQPEVLQTLVLRHEAISDDLNLRLRWNRLEIRVQDGPLGVDGLPMTVRVGHGVEAPGELILSLGGHMALVLEDQDLVVEESITDDSKVGIDEVTDSALGWHYGYSSRGTDRANACHSVCINSVTESYQSCFQYRRWKRRHLDGVWRWPTVPRSLKAVQ